MGVTLLETYQNEVTKIDEEIAKGELINDVFFEKINEAVPKDIVVERITAKIDLLT